MKTILVTILFISTILFGQTKAILKPSGEIEYISPQNKKISNWQPITNIKKQNTENTNLLYGLDTIGYDGSGGSNFGMYGQDVMLQWFQSPADMTIKGIGFLTGDSSSENFGPDLASMKIVKFHWNYEDLTSAGVNNWGYYEADNNGEWGASPFPDEADVTGDWFDTEGSGREPIFETTGWYDKGWIESIPISGMEGDTWYFASLLDTLGFELDIAQGEIFGIAIKNEDLFENNVADTNFFPLKSKDATIPAFKYYADGKDSSGVGVGWWSRNWVWSIVAVVDFVSGPNLIFTNMTILNTTLSTEARKLNVTLTMNDPSGGGNYVSEASIVFTIDDGNNWERVAMQFIENDIWSGEIPGQQPGTSVTYFIEAIDINSNIYSTAPLAYKIFKPESPFLFLYDTNSSTGFSERTMYDYFWGYNVPNDSLIYPDIFNTQQLGLPTMELLNNYNIVYWNTGFFPQTTPDGPLWKEWLDEATSENPRYLFLTGFEYGCAISECEDTTFTQGSFEYDYLGIYALAPQDIDSGSTDIYSINPVVDDEISGYMAKVIADSGWGLIYDREQISEYMAASGNWIDNIVPAPHATVYMTDPNNNDSPIGLRTEGDGWKVSYLQFDTYCLAFTTEEGDTINVTDYYGNIFDKHLQWFNYQPVTQLANKIINIPQEFSLKQNYPNPFNPSTIIRYTVGAIHESPLLVTLKIYDVLGREVQILVNKKQSAGKYQVTFNATDLASGIYYYKLKTQEFEQTRKMLFLK